MNVKVKKVLRNLDLYIAGTAFLVLVAITFLGVVMRYVFSNPFTWEEEVQVSMFVWVAFFGGSAAFRTHSHVSISMVYDALPNQGKRICAVFVYAVTVLTLFYLCLKSFAMVAQFASHHDITPVLSIPKAFLYGIIPLCSILMIINCTLDTIPRLKELFDHQQGEAKK